MTVVVFRNRDQLPAETGAHHCGHAAVHLHVGGVEVAGVCGKHHQGQMDGAVVGDEVSTGSWDAFTGKPNVCKGSRVVRGGHVASRRYRADWVLSSQAQLGGSDGTRTKR